MRRMLVLSILTMATALVLSGAVSVQARSAQANTFADGTFIVGTDIQPGSYRAQGGPFCYWERQSGFSGSLDDIIANDLASGPTIVTIAATDQGFKSEGCGVWAPLGPAITASAAAPFSDGTYLVGTDIEPGTWRASGGDTCYWQRLSGFGGTLDEIIANDIPTGAVIVTISPTDTGFSSSGCGTWSLAS